MSFSVATALRDARRAAGLSQEELAQRAGLSRMTVQKLEANAIDPRVSTLTVLVRALGLELALIPTLLQPAVDDFLRSGGRMVAQPAGIGAPPSIIDVIARVPAERASATTPTTTRASRSPAEQRAGERKEGKERKPQVYRKGQRRR